MRGKRGKAKGRSWAGNNGREVDIGRRGGSEGTAKKLLHVPAFEVMCGEIGGRFGR